jgi:hypothetical protein
MEISQRDAWISVPRFRPYLDAATGDLLLADALYEWHARLSAASFNTMHHFEVLVRNAIDAQLGAGQPDEPLRDTWLLDFETLSPNAVKQVITAVERLEKGRSISRARVVAGLSFGFWQGLFGGAYEELWRHRLRHAFPHAKQRKDLSSRLDAIRKFRNRIAHHDSILGQPIAARHDDMLCIAGYVDPNAEAWLARLSDVPALLAVRPA